MDLPFPEDCEAANVLELQLLVEHNLSGVPKKTTLGREEDGHILSVYLSF